MSTSRSPRIIQRDRDVCNVLALIAAPSHDQAADVYRPARLRETLRTAFHAGCRHRNRALATLRERTAKLPGPPRPDERHLQADHHAGKICRSILAMSDPPPDRHVAYFTEQLRRAMAAAWEAGAVETDRYIEAIEADLAKAAP